MSNVWRSRCWPDRCRCRSSVHSPATAPSGWRSEPDPPSGLRGRLPPARKRGAGLESRHLPIDIAEVVNRPDSKPSFAVDAVARDRTEEARILRTVSVVAHDEVRVRGNHLTVASVARIVVVVDPRLRQVRLVEPVAIDVDDAAADQDLLARGPDNALDELG